MQGWQLLTSAWFMDRYMTGTLLNIATVILGSIIGDSLSLADKYLAIHRKEIFAFHALLTGKRAYQECPVGTGKSLVGVISIDDAFQIRRT